MVDLSNSQNKFLDVIEKTLQNNKLSHAYLIEVNENLDNMRYIYSFIKLILCQTGVNKIDNINCNKCNICNLVDQGNYPDLKIIESIGQSIRKEQLIDLQDEYKNKSLLNNKMIYLIKNAEKLNQASANTILKFLEEPEDDIIAILLTDNRYNVLDTILSRCQILTLNSDSVSLSLDDKDIEIINFIQKKDLLFINYKHIISDIFTDKDVTKNILTNIEKFYLKYLEDFSNNNLFIYEKYNIKFKSTDIEKFTKYVNIIEEYLLKLKYNVNFKLWLDSLFAKLMEV